MDRYRVVMQNVVLPKMQLLKDTKVLLYTPFLMHSRYVPSDDPHEHQDILHAFCASCGQHGLRVGSFEAFKQAGGERVFFGERIVQTLTQDRYPSMHLPSVKAFIDDGWVIMQIKPLCPKCFREGVEKCSVCNCWVHRQDVTRKRIGTKMETVCSDECEEVAWSYYREHNDTQTVLSEEDAAKLKAFVSGE